MAQLPWIQSKSPELKNGRNPRMSKMFRSSLDSATSTDDLSGDFLKLPKHSMGFSRKVSNGPGEKLNRRHSRNSGNKSVKNQCLSNPIRRNHSKLKSTHQIMPLVPCLCKGMRRIS